MRLIVLLMILLATGITANNTGPEASESRFTEEQVQQNLEYSAIIMALVAGALAGVILKKGGIKKCMGKYY